MDTTQSKSKRGVLIATFHAKVMSRFLTQSCVLLLSVSEVREYFNNEGFNRWSKIYSESEDVNAVQKFIRSGHQETVDKCLRWIDADGTAASMVFPCFSSARA